MQEKRTVFLIDADVNLLEDLQRRFMLEPEFELVGVATLGMEGFGRVQQLRPDFVVLAHPLPDVDVLQLISNLNMSVPQAKKIVTLEVENPILTTQCMQTGANHVMVKPYSVDKLIEVMRSLARQNNMGTAMYPPTQFATFQNPSMQGPSFEQLKGAMNQFAQQQQERAQSGSFAMPTPGPGYSFNSAGPGMPYGPFPAPQPNIGMPYPPMSDINMGMNTGGQQHGGGFRTLKQTIIAVNCPKGGAGKTTISKELAIAFATTKVNGQPLKVCLVDCDLDFGDVASMLKVNPYPNITHWTSDIAQRLRENPNGEIRYPQQIIESKYLITHHTGLKILAAPSNHSDALDITGKEIEIVIDNLKACDFDVIILDTGNNTKDYTLIALDKAHVILMVTTLDVTTINDTNMLLNTLRSIHFPTNKIQLIVNRMPKVDKDIDISEISQVLRAPIIGVVPEYPKIRQLNNSGTPAVLGRDTEFTAAIRQIGNKILPVFNKAIAPKKAKARGGADGKGGFFSRIFGMR